MRAYIKKLKEGAVLGLHEWNPKAKVRGKTEHWFFLSEDNKTLMYGDVEKKVMKKK